MTVHTRVFTHDPKAAKRKALMVFDRSPAQRRAYGFIVDFHKQQKRMPTARQIADFMAWDSVSSANDCLIKLAMAGLVLRIHSSYQGRRKWHYELPEIP